MSCKVAYKLYVCYDWNKKYLGHENQSIGNTEGPVLLKVKNNIEQHL